MIHFPTFFLSSNQIYFTLSCNSSFASFANVCLIVLFAI